MTPSGRKSKADGRLAIRGATLRFRADPFIVPPDEAIAHDSDGVVVVEDGRIIDVGPAAVLQRYPGIAVDRYPGHLVLAGFVDCHAHYPQVRVIASYGKQLIDWLNDYTFPEEQRFADPAYAREVAELYLDECFRNGTTTASVYCTVHPQSVEAFFEAAAARGAAFAAGKVLMDRNAPKGLRDTAQRGYDQSKALIERLHGRGRFTYVITPRFAPTSSPAQLEAAGTLWREHPGTLLQTHVSENRREIAWVGELFPEAPDYMGVYERHGLVGPGANFGHAIHLAPREIGLFRDSGAAISHCPTSNTFIGSGLFDLMGLHAGARPVTVGLATDVGGGSSFSMLATMKAAYEIAQLRGESLDPVRAFYLATVGSATVMGMQRQLGNLVAGNAADIVVIDMASSPLLAERMRRASNVRDALFARIILADDRAVRATYVAGRKVYDRDSAVSAARRVVRPRVSTS